MSKNKIYFFYVTIFLVTLISHARSQNNTKDSTTSQTTITSFNLEDSTVAETSAPTESENAAISQTTTTENSDITTKNINSTEKTASNTTENNNFNIFYDTGATYDESSNSENRDCGCNEHLGYLCGCGERCPIPGIFGPGPICPQYCLEQLTCVCDAGYGRDAETNLCVACPTWDYEYYK